MPTGRIARGHHQFPRQSGTRFSRLSILQWDDRQYRLVMYRCLVHVIMVMVGILLRQDIAEIRKDHRSRWGGSHDCSREGVEKEYGQAVTPR